MWVKQYTVLPGESWYSIAGKMYGNQRYFAMLASYNGGRDLHPGDVIDIPDLLGIEPGSKPQQPDIPPGASTYFGSAQGRATGQLGAQAAGMGAALGRMGHLAAPSRPRLPRGVTQWDVDHPGATPREDISVQDQIKDRVQYNRIQFQKRMEEMKRMAGYGLSTPVPPVSPPFDINQTFKTPEGPGPWTTEGGSSGTAPDVVPFSQYPEAAPNLRWTPETIRTGNVAGGAAPGTDPWTVFVGTLRNWEQRFASWSGLYNPFMSVSTRAALLMDPNNTMEYYGIDDTRTRQFLGQMFELSTYLPGSTEFLVKWGLRFPIALSNWVSKAVERVAIMPMMSGDTPNFNFWREIASSSTPYPLMQNPETKEWGYYMLPSAGGVMMNDPYRVSGGWDFVTPEEMQAYKDAEFDAWVQMQLINSNLTMKLPDGTYYHPYQFDYGMLRLKEFEHLIRNTNGTVNWKLLAGSPDPGKNLAEAIWNSTGLSGLAVSFFMKKDGAERWQRLFELAEAGASWPEIQAQVEDPWAEGIFNFFTDPLGLFGLNLLGPAGRALDDVITKILFPYSVPLTKGLSKLFEPLMHLNLARTMYRLDYEVGHVFPFWDYFFGLSKRSQWEQWSMRVEDSFTLLARNLKLKGIANADNAVDIAQQILLRTEKTLNDTLVPASRLNQIYDALDLFEETMDTVELETLLKKYGVFSEVSEIEGGAELVHLTATKQDDIESLMYYVSQAARDKYARELGLQYKQAGALARFFSWSGQLVKESWLALNLKFWETNGLDNQIKTIIEGYLPTFDLNAHVKIALYIEDEYGWALPKGVAETLVGDTIAAWEGKMPVRKLATEALPWPIGNPESASEMLYNLFGLKTPQGLFETLRGHNRYVDWLRKMSYASALKKGYAVASMIERSARANIWIQAFEKSLRTKGRPEMVAYLMSLPPDINLPGLLKRFSEEGVLGIQDLLEYRKNLLRDIGDNVPVRPWSEMSPNGTPGGQRLNRGIAAQLNRLQNNVVDGVMGTSAASAEIKQTFDQARQVVTDAYNQQMRSIEDATQTADDVIARNARDVGQITGIQEIDEAATLQDAAEEAERISLEDAIDQTLPPEPPPPAWDGVDEMWRNAQAAGDEVAYSANFDAALHAQQMGRASQGRMPNNAVYAAYYEAAGATSPSQIKITYQAIKDLPPEEIYRQSLEAYNNLYRRPRGLGDLGQAVLPPSKPKSPDLAPEGGERTWEEQMAEEALSPEELEQTQKGLADVDRHNTHQQLVSDFEARFNELVPNPEAVNMSEIDNYSQIFLEEMRDFIRNENMFALMMKDSNFPGAREWADSVLAGRSEDDILKVVQDEYDVEDWDDLMDYIADWKDRFAYFGVDVDTMTRGPRVDEFNRTAGLLGAPKALGTTATLPPEVEMNSPKEQWIDDNFDSSATRNDEGDWVFEFTDTKTGKVYSIEEVEEQYEKFLEANGVGGLSDNEYDDFMEWSNSYFDTVEGHPEVDELSFIGKDGQVYSETEAIAIYRQVMSGGVGGPSFDEWAENFFEDMATDEGGVNRWYTTPWGDTISRPEAEAIYNDWQSLPAGMRNLPSDQLMYEEVGLWSVSGPFGDMEEDEYASLIRNHDDLEKLRVAGDWQTMEDLLDNIGITKEESAYGQLILIMDRYCYAYDPMTGAETTLRLAAADVGVDDAEFEKAVNAGLKRLEGGERLTESEVVMLWNADRNEVEKWFIKRYGQDAWSVLFEGGDRLGEERLIQAVRKNERLLAAAEAYKNTPAAKRSPNLQMAVISEMDKVTKQPEAYPFFIITDDGRVAAGATADGAAKAWKELYAPDGFAEPIAFHAFEHGPDGAVIWRPNNLAGSQPPWDELMRGGVSNKTKIYKQAYSSDTQVYIGTAGSLSWRSKQPAIQNAIDWYGIPILDEATNKRLGAFTTADLLAKDSYGEPMKGVVVGRTTPVVMVDLNQVENERLMVGLLADIRGMGMPDDSAIYVRAPGDSKFVLKQEGFAEFRKKAERAVVSGLPISGAAEAPKSIEDAIVEALRRAGINISLPDEIFKKGFNIEELDSWMRQLLGQRTAVPWSPELQTYYEAAFARMKEILRTAEGDTNKLDAAMRELFDSLWNDKRYIATGKPTRSILENLEAGLVGPRGPRQPPVVGWVDPNMIPYDLKAWLYTFLAVTSEGSTQSYSRFMARELLEKMMFGESFPISGFDELLTEMDLDIGDIRYLLQRAIKIDETVPRLVEWTPLTADEFYNVLEGGPVAGAPYASGTSVPRLKRIEVKLRFKRLAEAYGLTEQDLIGFLSQAGVITVAQEGQTFRLTIQETLDLVNRRTKGNYDLKSFLDEVKRLFDSTDEELRASVRTVFGDRAWAMFDKTRSTFGGEISELTFDEYNNVRDRINWNRRMVIEAIGRTTEPRAQADLLNRLRILDDLSLVSMSRGRFFEALRLAYSAEKDNFYYMLQMSLELLGDRSLTEKIINNWWIDYGYEEAVTRYTQITGHGIDTRRLSSKPALNRRWFGGMYVYIPPKSAVEVGELARKGLTDLEFEWDHNSHAYIAVDKRTGAVGVGPTYQSAFRKIIPGEIMDEFEKLGKDINEITTGYESMHTLIEVKPVIGLGEAYDVDPELGAYLLGINAERVFLMSTDPSAWYSDEEIARRLIDAGWDKNTPVFRTGAGVNSIYNLDFDNYATLRDIAGLRRSKTMAPTMVSINEENYNCLPGQQLLKEGWTDSHEWVLYYDPRTGALFTELPAAEVQDYWLKLTKKQGIVGSFDVELVNRFGVWNDDLLVNLTETLEELQANYWGVTINGADWSLRDLSNKPPIVWMVNSDSGKVLMEQFEDWSALDLEKMTDSELYKALVYLDHENQQILARELGIASFDQELDINEIYKTIIADRSKYLQGMKDFAAGGGLGGDVVMGTWNPRTGWTWGAGEYPGDEFDTTMYFQLKGDMEAVIVVSETCSSKDVMDAMQALRSYGLPLDFKIGVRRSIRDWEPESLAIANWQSLGKRLGINLPAEGGYSKIFIDPGWSGDTLDNSLRRLLDEGQLKLELGQALQLIHPKVPWENPTLENFVDWAVGSGRTGAFYGSVQLLPVDNLQRAEVINLLSEDKFLEALQRMEQIDPGGAWRNDILNDYRTSIQHGGYGHSLKAVWNGSDWVWAIDSHPTSGLPYNKDIYLTAVQADLIHLEYFADSDIDGALERLKDLGLSGDFRIRMGTNYGRNWNDVTYEYTTKTLNQWLGVSSESSTEIIHEVQRHVIHQMDDTTKMGVRRVLTNLLTGDFADTNGSGEKAILAGIFNVDPDGTWQFVWEKQYGTNNHIAMRDWFKRRGTTVTAGIFGTTPDGKLFVTVDSYEHLQEFVIRLQRETLPAKWEQLRQLPMSVTLIGGSQYLPPNWPTTWTARPAGTLGDFYDACSGGAGPSWPRPPRSQRLGDLIGEGAGEEPPNPNLVSDWMRPSEAGEAAPNPRPPEPQAGGGGAMGPQEPPPPPGSQFGEVWDQAARDRRASQQGRLIAEYELQMRSLNEWEANVNQDITSQSPGTVGSKVRTKAEKLKLDKTMDNVEREWLSRLDDASWYASGEVNRILFDYSARSQAEELLRYYAPFSTWQLRNPLFWAQAFARKPNLLMYAIRYNQAAENERRKRNLTSRFSNTVGFETQQPYGPFPAGYYGVNASNLFSIFNQFKPPFELPEDNPPDNEMIKKMRAIVQYGQTIGINPWPWLAYPMELAKILPPGSTSFSLGPVQRLVELGLLRGGYLQPGHTLMGESPTGTFLWDYWTRRRLDEMVREGTITLDQARNAKLQKAGPEWEQAIKDVMNVQTFSSLFNMVTPFSLKYASPGELGIREDLATRAQMFENQATTDLDWIEQERVTNQILEQFPALTSYSETMANDENKIRVSQIYDKYDAQLQQYHPWDTEYKELIGQRSAELESILGPQESVQDLMRKYTTNPIPLTPYTTEYAQKLVMGRLSDVRPRVGDYMSPDGKINWDAWDSADDDFWNNIPQLSKQFGCEVTTEDYIRYTFRNQSPEKIAYDLYKDYIDNQWKAYAEEKAKMQPGGQYWTQMVQTSAYTQYLKDLAAGYTPYEAQTLYINHMIEWSKGELPYEYKEQFTELWLEPLMTGKDTGINLSRFTYTVAKMMGLEGDSHTYTQLAKQLNYVLPGVNWKPDINDNMYSTVSDWFWDRLTPGERQMVADAYGYYGVPKPDEDPKLLTLMFTDLMRERQNRPLPVADDVLIYDRRRMPLPSFYSTLSKQEQTEIKQAEIEMYRYWTARNAGLSGTYTDLMTKYYGDPASGKSMFWNMMSFSVLNDTAFSDPVLSAFLSRCTREMVDFTDEQYMQAYLYFKENYDKLIDPKLTAEVRDHPDWWLKAQEESDMVNRFELIEQEVAKCQYYAVYYKDRPQWEVDHPEIWGKLGPYMDQQFARWLRYPYYLYFYHNYQYTRYYDSVSPDVVASQYSLPELSADYAKAEKDMDAYINGSGNWTDLMTTFFGPPPPKP